MENASYLMIISKYVFIGLLIVVGYLDLRHREVEYDIIYIPMFLLGLATGGTVLDKVIGCVAFPFVMLGASLLLGKIKKVECGTLVGGADIKTVAVTGLAFGPYALIFSMFLAVFEAIPFVKNPRLGMEKTNGEAEEERGGIPLCTLLAANIILLTIIQLISFAVRTAKIR